MVNQIFEQRRIQDRTELKFLPSDSRTDDREDARTNHRTDSERRQAQPAQRFLELLVRIFRIRNQPIDILGAEKLCAQSSASGRKPEESTCCHASAQHHTSRRTTRRTFLNLYLHLG